MVPRCGYYAENGVLIRKTVWIEWNRGFDKEAKRAYGFDMIEALKDLGPVAEVTTGSPFYETRSLSPFFVKSKARQDLSVEDYWAMLKTVHKNISQIDGLFDMVYLQSLTPKHLDVVKKYRCYCDMFDNPSKSFGKSQACSLAIYKVLEQLDLLHLLRDNTAFMDWRTNKMEIDLKV